MSSRMVQVPRLGFIWLVVFIVIAAGSSAIDAALDGRWFTAVSAAAGTAGVVVAAVYTLRRRDPR